MECYAPQSSQTEGDNPLTIRLTLPGPHPAEGRCRLLVIVYTSPGGDVWADACVHQEFSGYIRIRVRFPYRFVFVFGIRV